MVYNLSLCYTLLDLVHQFCCGFVCLYHQRHWSVVFLYYLYLVLVSGWFWLHRMSWGIFPSNFGEEFALNIWQNSPLKPSGLDFIYVRFLNFQLSFLLQMYSYLISTLNQLRSLCLSRIFPLYLNYLVYGIQLFIFFSFPFYFCKLCGDAPSFRTSQVVQWQRTCLLMQEVQETQVQSRGGEDPLEEEMANLLQDSCQKDPMDRGAWQAAVHGVRKSWARLSDRAHTPLVNF